MQTASFIAEKIVGHNTAQTTADVSNPGQDGGKYGEPNEKMLALVWQGKGKVEVVETSKPKLIDARDAIVRVTGSTICGSDLHLLHSAIMQLKPGDILGHEFCGVVESAGPEAEANGLKVGQRVVASFQIACGSCKYCKEGLSSMCANTNPAGVPEAMWGNSTSGFFGYSHMTGGYAGGQAEYVRVPFGDVNLLPLPDDVPDEKGLYLSDVLATAYHSVVDTGVEAGNNVAVWGAGPIGLFVAYFAFKKGGKRVILIDDVQWRLDWAKHKLPNVEVLNFGELARGESVTKALHERVPGGWDVCIDAVGGEYSKGWGHAIEISLGAETDSSEIINEMITSTRHFGRCGLIAAYAGFTNHVNVGSLMERGIRLIGNGQAPVHKYWKELLAQIQSGELDPTIMLSHRVKLEDTAKAYYKFEARDPKVRMMKTFIETKASAPRLEHTPILSAA
ncbi:alcohol dehydrogenase [Cylindrobasidium torrendii FP15055 ss-10]|uniref:Alcohol dehydrogenase n=1 Tax=Cylindrobasidium torrendii FP15055 ss-10 TaxID=1314674 RepID=A0A0D7B1U4_9AGAR|nr:alcohol dehydrogenase [Cylindrobasidium torrendii FP15055 ss-10]